MNGWKVLGSMSIFACLSLIVIVIVNVVVVVIVVVIIVIIVVAMFKHDPVLVFAMLMAKLVLSIHKHV